MALFHPTVYDARKGWCGVVTLNGHEVDKAQEWSVKQGWVAHFVMDRNGAFARGGDGMPYRVIRTGEVRFKGRKRYGVASLFWSLWYAGKWRMRHFWHVVKREIRESTP